MAARLVAAFSLCLMIAAQSLAREEPQVVESRIGALPATCLGQFHADDFGRHVAVIATEDGLDGVWTDGRQWLRREGTHPYSFLFSPGGERLACIVSRTPSGQQAARRTWSVLLDNKMGMPWDRVIPGSLTFTPDGRHFGYAATARKQWFVVVDGRIRIRSSEPPTARTTRVGRGGSSIFALSSDGTRVALATEKGGKAFVVLDGKRGPVYEKVEPDSITFSPDSRHLAYMARNGSEAFVVLDGKPQQGYDALAVGSLRFTSDSRHLVYGALEKGRWTVAMDGKPGVWHDKIVGVSPTIGGTGRVAYIAQDNGKWFVILDGRRGPAFDHISAEHLTFSPDGNRLAYAAKRGERVVAVVDGQIGRGYDSLGDLQFSPDGKSFAYSARSGDKRQVIRDETAGLAASAEIGRLRFSPDSRHLAYFVELEPTKHTIVVDQEAGPVYDALIQNGPWFRDNHTVEFLAIRGADLYRVRMTLGESSSN